MNDAALFFSFDSAMTPVLSATAEIVLIVGLYCHKIVAVAV